MQLKGDIQMEVSRKEVESLALRLSASDRKALIDRLAQSLEGTLVGDFETEWVAEAESRYTAYKEGLLNAVPADDVLPELRSRAKKCGE